MRPRKRCTARVWDASGTSSGPCGFGAKFGDFCGMHDPTEKKRRNDARRLVKEKKRQERADRLSGRDERIEKAFWFALRVLKTVQAAKPGDLPILMPSVNSAVAQCERVDL